MWYKYSIYDFCVSGKTYRISIFILFSIDLSTIAQKNVLENILKKLNFFNILIPIKKNEQS